MKGKACKGILGTFAGRRPPKCPQKRAKFDELKQMNLLKSFQALENAEGGCVGAGRKRRERITTTQEKYMQTMGSHTQALARVGVLGTERTRLVAADWQARIRPHLKGDGSKAKSEGADAEDKLGSKSDA